MGLDLYLGAGLAGGAVLYAGYKGVQAAAASVSKKAGDLRYYTILLSNVCRRNSIIHEVPASGMPELSFICLRSIDFLTFTHHLVETRRSIVR